MPEAQSSSPEDTKQVDIPGEKKWYRVAFWGDVVVQAESEREAEDRALEKIQTGVVFTLKRVDGDMTHLLSMHPGAGPVRSQGGRDA